jgi:hypothetical protein
MLEDVDKSREVLARVNARGNPKKHGDTVGEIKSEATSKAKGNKKLKHFGPISP